MKPKFKQGDLVKHRMGNIRGIILQDVGGLQPNYQYQVRFAIIAENINTALLSTEGNIEPSFLKGLFYEFELEPLYG